MLEIYGMQIAPELVTFIEDKALPGTGISPQTFWTGLGGLVNGMGPQNRALLAKRTELQDKIDGWHQSRQGQPHDAVAYEAFLREIGYIAAESPSFEIETTNVDPEIANLAGPQLVVPITNARFALNAANARWGSLYDALYGTDAIGDLPRTRSFDQARGDRVIAWGRVFLDETFALTEGSWEDVTGLSIVDGALVPALAEATQFAGYVGTAEQPSRVVLKNNGLHVILEIDAQGDIGSGDAAGINDITLEAALSTIMDCEDSVATVDAADKVLAYSNWLGLMQGNLSAEVAKDGGSFTRVLNDDLAYTTAAGESAVLKGRSLLLVRNVGHLMTNPAVLDSEGREAGEGLLDAMITVLIAMHDLQVEGGNSVHGSVYVVKPKMHGPDEVAFAAQIFDHVEDVLGLPRNTVKIGIMDEERRTSVNLAACIHAAKSRVAFINTGFLDRTGDEIHTAMEAGPMLRKGDMKSTPWINAYEARNVDIGLACGLSGRAQIGKGMWAMPDRMGEMLTAKVTHPQAGASCAWVPSPTAAVLHATHYHQVDVWAVQEGLRAKGARATLGELLTLPLLTGQPLDAADIMAEVENNAQGILGYVVRWIDQGIGCSKVPDIHDIGLMEDRATCRISSQALANWLHHCVVQETDVMAAMQKMAAVVDDQNASDAAYVPMSPGFDGLAFQAACDLVFKGRVQPSGYTEPVLHARRLEKKASV